MLNKLYDVIFFYDNIDFFWKIRRIGKLGGIKSLLAKLIYFFINSINNAFIPLNASFDDKPIFPHGIKGVFVSNGAIIGSNVVIFHQVTIGSNSLSDSKNNGSPIIGDNVYIGCGAKIIGKVRVGNNVRIGANCVVCEDIPDNSTVVLPKPRIIKKDLVMDNSFIKF